ncbi:unnamed protein product [Lactuca virosa]|uniref:Uncharacterized protein n=1 Tax=Lactuca virosa TaxID=75947 RepID=A0AAU9P405_9ASTR|nr:unnamed protein product [Lactuca virosa]
MASSPPSDRNFIVVDFHYNGTFAPNPLVYFDPDRASIRDWIEDEVSEDEDDNCQEDEDSVLSDAYYVDHEEDDAFYPFPANKTVNDRFLNNLCQDTVNGDEDDEYVLPQYPMHDERQP